jgi:hypothetical protein
LALAAPLVLSPAERDALVSELDAALGAGDLTRYRSLAERLYSGGLISASDLRSCLAAAAASEEETAVAGLAGSSAKGTQGVRRPGLAISVKCAVWSTRTSVAQHAALLLHPFAAETLSRSTCRA